MNVTKAVAGNSDGIDAGNLPGITAGGGEGVGAAVACEAAEIAIAVSVDSAVDGASTIACDSPGSSAARAGQSTVCDVSDKVGDL